MKNERQEKGVNKMEERKKENKGGGLMLKLKDNSKNILEVIAIILVIIAIAFGVSKFIMNKSTEDSTAITFYSYRISQGEIALDFTSPENEEGEVQVQVSSQAMNTVNQARKRC